MYHPSVSDTEKGLVSRLWTSPQFSAVASVCTIVSLVLAVYFYHASRRERALVYSVPPTRTVVFDPAETSKLQVSFDGKPVQTRVGSLQIVLWNSGREAIRREDVLDVVRISTIPAVPILEARLRRVTRRICGIKVNTVHPATGTVDVGWDILEENDGAQVQLIYEGPAEVKAVLVGTIVGQRSPENLDYARIDSSHGPLLMIKIQKVFLVCGLAVVVIFSWRVVFVYESASSILSRISYAAFIVLVIVVILYLVVDLWRGLSAPATPFVF